MVLQHLQNSSDIDSQKTIPLQFLRVKGLSAMVLVRGGWWSGEWCGPGGGRLEGTAQWSAKWISGLKKKTFNILR